MILLKQKSFFDYSQFTKRTATALKKSRDTLARDIMDQRKVARTLSTLSNSKAARMNEKILKEEISKSKLYDLGLKKKHSGYYRPYSSTGDTQLYSGKLSKKDLKNIISKQKQDAKNRVINPDLNSVIEGNHFIGKRNIYDKFGRNGLDSKSPLVSKMDSYKSKFREGMNKLKEEKKIIN